MANFRDADADETLVLVHTGKVLTRKIDVRQHTNDAPVLYLQLFDVVAPTVGTTAPNKVLVIPAGITKQVSVAVYNISGSLGGLSFGTALSFAVTTTHDGSTGPDAGDDPEVILDYTPIG